MLEIIYIILLMTICILWFMVTALVIHIVVMEIITTIKSYKRRTA